MADPTMALAVVDVNGNGGSKDMPIMGYAGFTWPNFIATDSGKIVEHNIASGPQIASSQAHGQVL